MYSQGNIALLELPKTAFLCSRKVAALAVLRCYDWAIAQREAGNCVISGFHSPIEKEVLHYLLKGNQPIIVALARGFKKQLEKEFVAPLAEGRLLIVSPFSEEISRITAETAQKRNELMLELADKVTVGYAKQGGNIAALIQNTSKPIEWIVGEGV
jgi:predicted Rossmann fold nucleotide-binding protein DprA/Smf involved in DNA uptake